jgi:hypothetical protein
MFGERSNFDLGKLSLRQQQILNQQSQAIEKATLNRARYQDGIRRNLSAAAATEQLAVVDRSSPNFDKQVASVVARYPEALGSTAFVKLLQDARSDRQLYQKAEATRATSTFNNPVVAKAYNDALEKYQDPHLANIAAKSTEELFTKAKSLASNQDISAQDRASIYNPQTGEFNLDPQHLTQLEVKAQTAKSQRDIGSSNLKNASAISTMLTHLNNVGDIGDESPELKAAREGGAKALQNYLSTLGTTKATPVDSTLDSYLGTAAPATTPAVSGTPAVTPEQAAAEPVVGALADEDAEPGTTVQ